MVNDLDTKIERATNILILKNVHGDIGTPIGGNFYRGANLIIGELRGVDRVFYLCHTTADHDLQVVSA